MITDPIIKTKKRSKFGRALDPYADSGLRAHKLVEQYILVRIENNSTKQLQLLSDELIVDSGYADSVKIRLPKADALNYYDSFKNGVELVGYENFNSFGSGNTVAVIGQRKERIVENRAEITGKFICIFTVKSGLIAKIEFMEETHILYHFFTSIIDRHSDADNAKGKSKSLGFQKISTPISI